MIKNFSDKVLTVQNLLRKHGFVVPETGEEIQSQSRKELCHLINALREVRGLGRGMMYDSNLSSFLNYPEKAPRNFVNELTTAMGLIDLGLSETLWDEELPTIMATVDSVLNGGVIATVLAQPINQVLFKMGPNISMGIRFKSQNPLPNLPPIREFTVATGSDIATEATLDYPAYLRVMACEEGEFIALNAFLSIPEGRIDAGTHRFGVIPTDERVARTLIYAFASSEPCFHGWPVTQKRSSRLKQGQFLKLLRGFYDLHPTKRDSSVQSFITTVSKEAVRQQ